MPRKKEANIVQILKHDGWVLFLLIAVGSAIALCTKFEFGFDFIHYHYYNALAFLQNRLNYDIVPAGINTFFNPLSDLPYYFIIEWFNDKPDAAYVLSGMCLGLLLFAFFKVCCLFFELKTKGDALSIFALLAIAVTGQSVFFQIGTCTNEIPVALFGFAGLYNLFLMIKEPQKQNEKLFFISGLILGAAMGFKATIIYVCVGAGGSLIVCYKYLRKPFCFIGLFALGGLLGYLLINGWWLYKMWSLYANPFMPFANGIFHSPYFDDVNFNDSNLIPPLRIALIFPLRWNGDVYNPTEQYFFDWHVPLFYIFGVAFLIYILVNAKARQRFLENRLMVFYATFLILSYVVWLSIFSIVRYLVIVEMMSAIFFVKIIRQGLEGQGKWAQFGRGIVGPMAALLFLSLFCNTPWVGRTDNSHLIEVEDIHLPKNTLLKLYGVPLSGFVVPWAKTNDFRVVGHNHLYNIPVAHSDFAERGRFREMRDEVEKNHKGPVVVLYREMLNDSVNYEKFHESLDKEIEGMYCRELKHNFEQDEVGVHICVPPELKTEILGDV